MKHNLIEKIAIEMSCTEKLLPDKQDVISDEIIINQIAVIDDLEQTDRDGRTLLINAVVYERFEVVKYLIENNADVNAQDKMGGSPLHFAVTTGNVGIAKLLLENGAKVNITNSYGNVPLTQANLNCPEDMFRLLMQFGANSELKNNFGVAAVDVYRAYPHIMSIIDPKD